MSKQRPYYSLHQIKTGQYTKGAEYYKESGQVYIGPYHVLPNQQVFTGFVPLKESEELFNVTGEFHSNTIYRGLTKVKTGQYLTPIYKFPEITNDDINRGYFIRYFVQRKSDPRNTIIEIDREQFLTVNSANAPGINGVLWRKIEIPWAIRGDITVISQVNENKLNSTEPSFPGIKKYITNLIEFLK